MPQLLSVVLLLLGAMVLGGMRGAAFGAPHGVLIQVLGAAAGAVLGGLAIVLAMVFLMLLPVVLDDVVRAARQPADLVCHCRDSAAPVPEHLLPQTDLQREAIAESHRLSEWAEYARLRSQEMITVDNLRSRLADGSVSEERVALAARLGHPAAQSLGLGPVEPLLKDRQWGRLLRDLQALKRSGLPPRLCVVWTVACVERVLPVFESEFHQDTRPRQAFGAALLVLKDARPDAVELCRSAWRLVWSAREAGCRVLHRDLGCRIMERPSPGEHAARAVFGLARAVWTYADPDWLWATCPPLGDMPPQLRCDLTQPCGSAGETAYRAAGAVARPKAEYQWQREELARMVLGWERWNEDREAWQARVEEEWIPRVLNDLKNVPFDVPAYAEQIRRELLPWRSLGRM